MLRAVQTGGFRLPAGGLPAPATIPALPGDSPVDAHRSGEPSAEEGAVEGEDVADPEEQGKGKGDTFSNP